ncbi:acetyl ornithine aminotransferase family protein [Anaeromyxobacter terrae]|uniref:acetyl ornithine aminotransferase family protein n=1 Tax=Anaeromyxobacter terrae TaxID=2925406 RepID=UPI001F578565|nr:acetyl ornithine aminotransferase family protein [Anaeromyxobacter sp. SG22]
METRSYPRVATPLPGPKGRAIIERDAQFTSTSYIKEYPLVMSGGSGAMVEDADGNRFIDFMAGIAVSATGYNHPEVVGAVCRQAERFFHICGTDFYYDVFARLAERLARLAPGPSRKRAFLTNSGTEAIEGAIKLARFHTRRPALIAFHGAFHGRSYGAMSLTSSKAKQHQHFGPFLPDVHHVPYCNPYRSSASDPAECVRATIRAIEEDLFTRHVAPEDVAAIFVEPLQGEGGYVVPPDGFLRALRQLCDRHGILLVADEVQSGVGRTGKMWACEWEDVEPDILVTAKGLGSGMPIGALVAKDAVMSWKAGSHGSTFGGNAVSCAAALATLDVVERTLPRVRAMGERMLSRARQIMDRCPIVGDVRGRGLMIGVELVKDRRTKEPHEDAIDRITQRAFRNGLLLLACGRSTFRLAPPLVLDEYDVDVGMDIFEKCLREES